MDRWLSVLTLLTTFLGTITAIWFRRAQFQETPQSQAAVAWLGRWMRRRADTPLRKDFQIVRRAAGWIALAIFIVTLLWSSVNAQRNGSATFLLDVFVTCLIVWASLNVWIVPARFVTQFGREFVLLLAAAPWIALALNRLLLGQWSAAPFDELMRPNSLTMIAASDSALLVTINISIFFLLGRLGIVLLAMLLAGAVRSCMPSSSVRPPWRFEAGWR